MFLLDVREPQEFANGHIQGAVNIPVRTLGQNLDKLPPKDGFIVAICAVGTRGTQAMMALSLLGWTNVKNMNLGMTEWTRQNFPVVK
jgi:rhodanese-related sulfurtransferase